MEGHFPNEVNFQTQASQLIVSQRYFFVYQRVQDGAGHEHDGDHLNICPSFDPGESVREGW